jgi:hypothetical protein
MTESLTRRISIFLSLNEENVYNYFNPHDPAPLYKRQPGNEIQDYITSSISSAKRSSLIQFKVICSRAADIKFADALMHAVKRHYMVKRAIKKSEFDRFKRRSFKILSVSLAIVIALQTTYSYLFTNEILHETFHNGLEVLTWVILWKPIDKLIFQWNPFLKELNIMDKLITSEVIVIEKHKNKIQASELLSVAMHA